MKDIIANSSNSNRNRSPIVQNRSKVKRSIKSKIALLAQNDEEFENSIGKDGLILSLPIRTVSEGNSFEHHLKKHSRHKKQQELINLALKPFVCQIKLPLTITLIRYAPRELDVHDNLPFSFKWISDQICATLIPGLKAGRADNDKRIKKFNFDQVKTKTYFIKIKLDWSDST